MDTTYFGRKFGVMVYKDSISGQILYKQYVKQETNKLYLAGLEEIARRGIKIQAVICDGRNSKELWTLVLLLSKTDKESFEGGLAAWHSKWESFLNERKVDINGKNRYVHKKLRSAYRSLKTNLPWLFTWYDNIDLNIPNTTNAIDGHFADLKNKLRNHNGLSIARKQKFIDEFLKA